MPRRTQLPEVQSGSPCPGVSDSRGEQPLLCVQWVGPAANKQLHPKWGGWGRVISSAATHGAAAAAGSCSLPDYKRAGTAVQSSPWYTNRL